jgi:hypothetical protein
VNTTEHRNRRSAPAPTCAAPPATCSSRSPAKSTRRSRGRRTRSSARRSVTTDDVDGINAALHAYRKTSWSPGCATVSRRQARRASARAGARRLPVGRPQRARRPREARRRAARPDRPERRQRQQRGHRRDRLLQDRPRRHPCADERVDEHHPGVRGARSRSPSVEAVARAAGRGPRARARRRRPARLRRRCRTKAERSSPHRRRPGAKWWAKHADAPFRFNSIAYEARKAGFDTPAKFRDLLDQAREPARHNMNAAERRRSTGSRSARTAKASPTTGSTRRAPLHHPRRLVLPVGARHRRVRRQHAARASVQGRRARRRRRARPRDAAAPSSATSRRTRPGCSSSAAARSRWSRTSRRSRRSRRRPTSLEAVARPAQLSGFLNPACAAATISRCSARPVRQQVNVADRDAAASLSRRRRRRRS